MKYIVTKIGVTGQRVYWDGERWRANRKRAVPYGQIKARQIAHRESATTEPEGDGGA